MPTGLRRAARTRRRVLREVRVDLEQLPVVRDALDERDHVVRLVRRRGHDAIQLGVLAVGGSPFSRRGGSSRLFDGRNDRSARIFWRQSASESATMCATPRRPRACPRRERLLRDVLVRDRLDDVRPRHEHRLVPRTMRMKSVIAANTRRPRAGAEDRRDLGDDSRGERIAEKNVRVSAEGNDAFLDAGASRVVETDDGRAHLHREIHELADLRGVRLGQGTAEHREVLREHEDRAVLDAHDSRDDAVAGDRVRLVVHAEVARAVHDERVDFVERSRSPSSSTRSRAVSLPALCCSRACPLRRRRGPLREGLQGRADDLRSNVSWPLACP